MPEPFADFVAGVRAADASKPEATFDNWAEMLGWLEAPVRCPIGLEHVHKLCSAGYCSRCSKDTI